MGSSQDSLTAQSVPGLGGGEGKRAHYESFPNVESSSE